MLKDILQTSWQKGLSEKDSELWFNQIEEMVNHRKLISVYDAGMGRIDGGDYLDGSILKALFKSTANEALTDNGLSELKLALAWDRIDLVQDLVFNDDPSADQDEKLTGDHYFYLLPFALENERVAFVKEFLAHGLVINEFLTIKRLIILYNKTVINLLCKFIVFL